MKGSDFVRQVTPLSRPDRETAIAGAVADGQHLPISWVEINFTFLSSDGKSHAACFCAAADYFAIGTPEDFVRVPMSPLTAQRIADMLGAMLPTTRMVDLVWKQAAVKLNPQPMTPPDYPYDASMLSVARFDQHNKLIEQQRKARAGLVRGHKKDVVLTNRLETQPGHVAIYGWPDARTGKPIQPLSLVHEDSYADYSHGIGFIHPRMRLDGADVAVSSVLQDPKLAGALSDEGVLRVLRQPGVSAGSATVPVSPRAVDYTLPLGERCVAWERAELAAGARPSDARITWYFSKCVRDGKPLTGLTSKDNWCAASACAAAAACSVDGETLPHAYRASGVELVADAKASGAWHDVAEVTAKKWRPCKGDLAIFKRGQAGQSNDWERHVARIEIPPAPADATGAFCTIGGNEGAGIWKETDHRLDEPDLLGFIAYPKVVAATTQASAVAKLTNPPLIALPAPATTTAAPVASASAPTLSVAIAPTPVTNNPAVAPITTPVITLPATPATPATPVTPVTATSTPLAVAPATAMTVAPTVAAAPLAAAPAVTIASQAGTTAAATTTAPATVAPVTAAAASTAAPTTTSPTSPTATAPPETMGTYRSTLSLTALMAAMVAIGLAPRLPGGVAWVIEMALMYAFLAVLGLATCGQALGVLIDAQKLVRLSRFQAVLWTVIVLSAYFTMALRRIAEVDPLAIAVDWHLWALMGISTTSLVGTPLLQGSKKNDHPSDAACKATANALGQPEAEVREHGRGALYGNPQIDDARLSDMFGGDEVGNAAYVDLSKVQMFFFTMVAALIYSVLLYETLEKATTPAQLASFPSLGSGLIGVLGLSHGARLGMSAIHETQKSDAGTAGSGAGDGAAVGTATGDASVQKILEVVNRIDRTTYASKQMLATGKPVANGSVVSDPSLRSS